MDNGTHERVEALAKEAFENAASKFFTDTINMAKFVRPSAKWGFYGCPYCNYDAGQKGEYECKQEYKDWNDNMTFIFNESIALYPSIYLSSNSSITSQQRARYIYAVLKEAQRISKKYNPPRPIYAYTKIEYDPKEEPDKFYSNSDLCSSILQPANMGVDGVIFWSSSKNMSFRCELIQAAVNNRIGQVVKNITEAHEKCRTEKCSSNGRCVLLHNTTCNDAMQYPSSLNHSEYKCQCDYGYKGERCNSTIHNDTSVFKLPTVFLRWEFPSVVTKFYPIKL
ncbi:EGF-like domain protein [Oesophagostomum dentatum]|uniref:Hyaluronidase n=1 Tax=Oesophagostomum dentatum TaxID=61180 RepID=A0A0B1SDE7_OESDE|nr:EGF-like domain protein [Oesophagostomum dentatum]